MLSITPWKRTLPPTAEDRVLPPASVRPGLDGLFDHFFDGAWRLEPDADPLRIDVREGPDALIVRAELPGVDPEDIAIELHGDLLVISGEKREQRDQQAGTLTYSERRYGGFRRALRLATPVDPEQVRAEHKHGLVTITLQKADSARPRRIQLRPS